ncbi:MAG: MOSC domain-containing protein [Actinobacteria bacterium]|nr:MOSC domain-containing protein [Actinomycetota bacterium]
MAGSVIAVNVGRVAEVGWAGGRVRTAIDKRSHEGRLAVGPAGVAGDEHADVTHGGVHQAVYAYAREDAEFWERELGREIPAGRFGENLTTVGIEVSSAVSGARWRVGTALLEVTIPRMPCKTFAGFWDVPQLVKRFTAAGRPGAYLSVIEAGEIGAGDMIEVVDHPDHGVTVAQLMAARAGDRSRLEQIRSLALSPKWQAWLASVDPG